MGFEPTTSGLPVTTVLKSKSAKIIFLGPAFVGWCRISFVWLAQIPIWIMIYECFLWRFAGWVSGRQSEARNWSHSVSSIQPLISAAWCVGFWHRAASTLVTVFRIVDWSVCLRRSELDIFLYIIRCVLLTTVFCVMLLFSRLLFVVGKLQIALCSWQSKKSCCLVSIHPLVLWCWHSAYKKCCHHSS